jgi:hypothetical protein
VISTRVMPWAASVWILSVSRLAVGRDPLNFPAARPATDVAAVSRPSPERSAVTTMRRNQTSARRASELRADPKHRSLRRTAALKDAESDLPVGEPTSE